MAKITISELTAAFASTTALNAKFQQIEDALNNLVLYRDNTGTPGEPNSMAQDLDMAGFNLLNVNNISEFATPSIDADEVVVTPAGNISATDAQAALEELDGEKPQIFDGKTGAPTVNDDISNGYKKGDSWIDETNDAAYTSVDETTGAAVWIQTGTDTGTVTSVGAVAPITSSGGANPTIEINPATQSNPGSMSSIDKEKMDTIPELRMLDEAVLLVSSPLATATWTTVNMSSAYPSAAFLEATIAVVKIVNHQEKTASTLLRESVYLRKTGSGLSIGNTTLASDYYITETTSSTMIIRGTEEVLVNLDSLSDFDYYHETLGPTTNLTKIYLVGYYIL